MSLALVINLALVISPACIPPYSLFNIIPQGKTAETNLNVLNTSLTIVYPQQVADADRGYSASSPTGAQRNLQYHHYHQHLHQATSRVPNSHNHGSLRTVHI
jgi:hypothetical protein